MQSELKATMRYRAFIVCLVSVVVALGWWALRREEPSAPESARTAHDDEPAPRTVAHGSDPPTALELDDPIAFDPTSSSVAPLVRQRERLRTTADQLRTRRERALGDELPRATVRTLDDHIARIELRLSLLDATSDPWLER